MEYTTKNLAISAMKGFGLKLTSCMSRQKYNMILQKKSKKIEFEKLDDIVGAIKYLHVA